MIKLIAFDLDNVLIDGESIDEIAKMVGVEEEISELTRQAMEGDINFETSLQQRIKLLKGTSIEEIQQVVDSLSLMEGTEETIKELKRRGYKLATITGNFDIVTRRLKELDIDYIFCNKLHEEDGILNGEISGPLIAEGSKADVLQELMEQEGVTAEECAAVGDGANDISMIKKAGLGIAFNAKSAVKEVADVVIDNRDLREILPIFEINSDDLTEGSSPKNEPAKSENMSNTKSEDLINPAENEDISPAKEDKIDNPAKDDKADQTQEEADKETKSQVNEDAGKSFSKLLGEKKDLEKNLKELTRERDALNDEAKEHKLVRDDLNASIKEILDKALEYRKKRDEINQEVKKYKKLRDETNQELKKLEWSSGRRDIIKIQDEIKKLDKTIETKVLDIRKENELVKKVTDLQKKLQTMQEDENTKKEALELKELSESYHAKVVELSDQAQETHEQMLTYFKKIDEIRAKADEAHAQFISTREKASAKHEEVKNILKEIRGKNKSLDKAKAKERHKEDIISEKKNLQEKEKAEEIYRKFRDGKKLTTDELLLLQKHNVV
ncbi:MAG TPA: phosphoserine phosphatase SerB [Methanobacterium sp.]|nr:phosphoserine phosphatase SerB [Methanobacterium sp.]